MSDVMNLLKSNNELFSVIPKAKTAKIVRNILNLVASIPDSLNIQTQLCKDVIEWCKLEKRTFLKQRVEAKVSQFVYIYLYKSMHSFLLCVFFFLLLPNICIYFLSYISHLQLASLLLQQKDSTAALTLINALLHELKKLDDKQMLTEVHLTESRIYHALENIPKSKAALTASRSAANSIYVSPLLQAEIDEMSGMYSLCMNNHQQIAV